MFKSKLQELCQRRSWNLPEYTTVKDGPDHIPQFTAVVAVNGRNFETPDPCKSSKDAQNTVARIALEHLTGAPAPAPTQSPHIGFFRSEDRAIFQSPVPEMRHSAVVSPPPAFPGHAVPPERSSANCYGPINIKPASQEIMPPNGVVYKQTSTVSRTTVGSRDMLLMYKNRLQQYAQKNNLGLPVYTSESEGPPHNRRFKSRVSYDGKSYESLEFFTTLKEAEHEAARIACKMLNINEIQEDGGLYKNLLQELAQKRGFLCPIYETVKSGASHIPDFSSKVMIGSDVYCGAEAKSKKQAEMNAAKVAYSALSENFRASEKSRISTSLRSSVTDDLPKNIYPNGMIKNDVNVADEESEIDARRTKTSAENVPVRLLARPHINSSSNHSSLFSTQLEQSIANDPVMEPKVEPQQPTIRKKTVVFPRKLNLPIPEGATVKSYSDDQWVAYTIG